MLTLGEVVGLEQALMSLELKNRAGHNCFGYTQNIFLSLYQIAKIVYVPEC